MPFDLDTFYYIENEGLPYALAKDVGSSFLIRGSDPSKWSKIKPALSTEVWRNGSRISKEKAFAMASDMSMPKPDKFGNLRSLITEEEFDPALWEEVRPIFQEIWDDLIKAGKSGAEFIRLALEHLTSKGEPYLEKFIREDIPRLREKKDATTDNNAEPGEGKTGDNRTGDEGHGTGDVPGTKEGETSPEGTKDAGTSPVGGGDSVDRSSKDPEYFENEGLPYALWTPERKSFLMRGASKADWFRINSDVVAKVWMNGEPISEEEALAMSRELSVPNQDMEGQDTPPEGAANKASKETSIKNSIIDDAVNYLRGIQANLSGDDSPLANPWEEVKEQVQNEPSFFWDAYLETMRQFIDGNVEMLSEEDREVLAEELDLPPDDLEELCGMMMELLLDRAREEEIRYAPFDFTHFRYIIENFDVYCQILERTGMYQFRIAGYSVAEPDGEEGEMNTRVIGDIMSKEEFDQARQMNWPENWEEAKAGLSDESELEDEDDIQDQAEEETESESSNLEKAISLAVEGHKGQEDKAGAPYILHPLRLMFKMDSEEKMIAAILHDLIEDTETTLDDLKEYGFDTGILEAIDSVTRRDEEGYEEFIDRAGLHPIGADIKMADIQDNMDLSRISFIGDRDLKRLKKYHRAMARIKELEAIRSKPMEVRYYKEGGNVQVATVTLVPRGLPYPSALNAYGSAGTIIVDFAGILGAAVMPENFLDLRLILKTKDPRLLYSYFDLWAPFFCPECVACYTDEEWDIGRNGFGICPQGHRRKIMKVELDLEDYPEIELRLERDEAASTSHVRSNKSGSQDRYETVGNDIVRDHQTGLEWVTGPDKDTDWNQAKAWVETLQVDGSGWRMPSVAELKCLFGEDFWNRQMNPILQTTGSFVWSRETVGLANAKGLSLSDGNCNWNCARGYANRCRAFAARFRGDGETYTLHPQPALKTNGFQGRYEAIGNDIVRDKQTDLEWLTGPDKDTTWDEAKAWVESLTLGGGGWRMPTLNELKELYEKGLGERNMSPLLRSTGWWVLGEREGSFVSCYFDFSVGSSDWQYSKLATGYRRAFAVRPRRDG